MTPSETPQEQAPADAARRQFIEKYGPLALATPAAMYALMSPRRAQAQVVSVYDGICNPGQDYIPGGSCDFSANEPNDSRFEVTAVGSVRITSPALGSPLGSAITRTGNFTERHPDTNEILIQADLVNAPTNRWRILVAKR